MAIDLDWNAWMSAEKDLDKVQRALIRETAIRRTMAQTGEGRDTVVDMIEAMESMDHEAVLDLTEGEPTTFRDAVLRYVAELEKRDPDGDELTPVARVTDELGTILAYPWSDEEERLALHDPHYGLALHVTQPEYDRVEVRIGSNRWLVANVDPRDDHAVATVAEAVHRATLVRVIGDRDHHVDLSRTDLAAIRLWLEAPSGSIVLGRLTLDAGGPGGVIVRTRPFSHQADSALSKRV